MELPELVSLDWANLGQGELVLSCPKLVEACFHHTWSLHMVLEAAKLYKMALWECDRVEVTVRSPEVLLQDLTDLSVWCKLIGRHIMDDVAHMRNLNAFVGGFQQHACQRAFPGVSNMLT